MIGEPGSELKKHPIINRSLGRWNLKPGPSPKKIRGPAKKGEEEKSTKALLVILGEAGDDIYALCIYDIYSKMLLLR